MFLSTSPSLEFSFEEPKISLDYKTVNFISCSPPSRPSNCDGDKVELLRPSTDKGRLPYSNRGEGVKEVVQ